MELIYRRDQLKKGEESCYQNKKHASLADSLGLWDATTVLSKNGCKTVERG